MDEIFFFTEFICKIYVECLYVICFIEIFRQLCSGFMVCERPSETDVFHFFYRLTQNFQSKLLLFYVSNLHDSLHLMSRNMGVAREFTSGSGGGG